MRRQNQFVNCALLCLSMVAAGYSQNQPPKPPEGLIESGLTPVKSRWYRHVAVMMGSPIPAATASMGVPSNPVVPLGGGGFGGSRRGFMYEATIKNNSTREVKALHWDHVFLDPKNGTELGRFHFFNDRQSIGKGKTKTFQRFSGRPPSGTIDVGALEKNAGPQYNERIDIKCVLFKGDVVWQAVNASGAECVAIRRKIKKAK